MVSEEYRVGFIDGYTAASDQLRLGRRGAGTPHGMNWALSVEDAKLEAGRQRTKRPKRKQSGKAKLLTQMTAPVWKKYKKGSGKKTYVQIRAQVSRSQAYKRKAKKL